MRRSAVLVSRLLRATNTSSVPEALRAASCAQIGASASSIFLPSCQPVATGPSARSFASDASDDDELAAYYSGPVMYPSAVARVGQKAPGFTLGAVVDGEIKKVSLADYKGKYVVLFFYPKDFTFVCPTEIIAFSDRAKEFEALNCQLIAASTDTEESHLAWIRMPRNRGGLGYMQIPILADVKKELSARYGCLHEDAGIALRGLYIINPEGVLEHITVNNFPIGRSVDETLRTLQAIQYVAKHGEVCPANWKPGEKTMVADAEKSLEYFSTVKTAGDEEVIGAKLTPIKSRKEFELATQGNSVIDFYAPWCGKCRQISPFVDQLVDKFPGVSFYKLDTTDEAVQALAAELGVKAMPAFRFFKGGKEAQPEVTGYKKQLLEAAVSKLASS